MLSLNCHLVVMERRYQTAREGLVTCAGERAPLAGTGLARRRLGRARLRWLPAAALLAPSLLFLMAFTYWPVLQVLIESIIVGRFAGQQALGLDNYRRLFADPHFARALWNNLAYAAGTIVPGLVLALLFALALRGGSRL